MSKRQKVRKCRNVNCEHNAFKHKNTRRYGERCLTPAQPCTNKITDVVILHVAVSSKEYDPRILTDEELTFCLENETRKTGLKILHSENKLRMLEKRKRL